MINNIYFYNDYHYGDIHVSREFVKWVIKNVSHNKAYYYTHYPNSSLLLDINVEMLDISQFADSKNDRWYINDNNLYACTWYGSYSFKCYSGQDGIRQKTLQNIFERGLKETIGIDIEGDEYCFVPEIDFSIYNKINIDLFLKNNNYKKIVLFCDNEVRSGQSENFDFKNIIKKVSIVFPDILFVSTNGRYNDKNIITIGNIIGRNDNNLNEISYFSNFCCCVIGRSSGPFTYCHTKNNISKKIVMISFIKCVDMLVEYCQELKIDHYFGYSCWLIEDDKINIIKKHLELIK